MGPQPEVGEGDPAQREPPNRDAPEEEAEETELDGVKYTVTFKVERSFETLRTSSWEKQG